MGHRQCLPYHLLNRWAREAILFGPLVHHLVQQLPLSGVQVVRIGTMEQHIAFSVWVSLARQPLDLVYTPIPPLGGGAAALLRSPGGCSRLPLWGLKERLTSGRASASTAGQRNIGGVAERPIASVLKTNDTFVHISS